MSLNWQTGQGPSVPLTQGTRGTLGRRRVHPGMFVNEWKRLWVLKKSLGRMSFVCEAAQAGLSSVRSVKWWRAERVLPVGGGTAPVA